MASVQQLKSNPDPCCSIRGCHYQATARQTVPLYSPRSSPPDTATSCVCMCTLNKDGSLDRRASYRGISPSCSKQNGVTSRVYTLQRIVPILSVGSYFKAFRPTNDTLVTLVWWCITFWSILTNSLRKMLDSWSCTGG